jgi:hypothetical protein
MVKISVLSITPCIFLNLSSYKLKKKKKKPDNYLKISLLLSHFNRRNVAFLMEGRAWISNRIFPFLFRNDSICGEISAREKHPTLVDATLPASSAGKRLARILLKEASPKMVDAPGKQKNHPLRQLLPSDAVLMALYSPLRHTWRAIDANN